LTLRIKLKTTNKIISSRAASILFEKELMPVLFDLEHCGNPDMVFRLFRLRNYGYNFNPYYSN